MKELRCILFTDLEVLAAILDRRRKLNEALPDGQVTGLRLEMNQGTRCTLLVNGGKQSLAIPEAELQASLLAYCMTKKVPLPAEADKSVYLIRGRATLMMTMNFNKSARLVSMVEERADSVAH